MSHQLIATFTLDVPPSRSSAFGGEEIGGCVVCKRFIFHQQDYGRAQRPMLGKAHTWCGGR